MTPNRCDTEAIKRAIEIIGSPADMAKKLNVSYHTVLTWKNGRSSITTTNCMKIEKATEGKIKAKDILPDYPWEDLE